MATRVALVTHGILADALKKTAGIFFGPDADEIIALGLSAEDSPEALSSEVEKVIREAYEEDGIIIFVDMVSGTPFNAVAMALANLVESCPQIECFAGVNLPVLMEIFSNRVDTSFEELTKQAAEVFPRTFVDLRALLEI